jgi:peptide/nickel transport system permease protein
MGAYLLRRLLASIGIIIGTVFVVFMMIHLIPGDPVLVMLHESASAEEIEAFREKLGLNDPLYEQFGRFMINLAHGDLGRTIRGDRPVMEEILIRYPNTVLLASAALAFAVLSGGAAGIISGIKRNTLADYIASTASLVGMSMPTFWLGLLLIMVFALRLHWFPTGGKGTIKNLIMPAVTLGSMSAATIARFTRSSLIEVMNFDYIRTARAKGLDEPGVIFRHALKNACIPVVTVIAISFGRLLAGAVIVENIFSWPGIGKFLVNAILARDFPVVQGTVLFVAVGFVAINFLVDILYTYLDPRVRLT